MQKLAKGFFKLSLLTLGLMPLASFAECPKPAVDEEKIKIDSCEE